MSRAEPNLKTYVSIRDGATSYYQVAFPPLLSDPKKPGSDFGIFVEGLGRGGMDNPATAQDVDGVCILQRKLKVLLNQENGNATLLKFLNDLPYRLDENWRKTFGRFIHQ